MSNAADPKRIQEQEQRLRHDKDLAAGDLRWIMEDVRGRRFIQSLLEFCGPLRTPFNTNGSLSNFNMGMQNVGLKIFADIEESCPDLYLAMKTESRKKEE